MRMRPIDIEVPDDDPFANDRLDRRDQAEAVAAILARIEGPFVIAIDAPWGEGKTTFLRLSQTHLRAKEFLVVSFNAWETDFCDDPFIALTREVVQELKLYVQEDRAVPIQSVGMGDRINEAVEKLEERSLSLSSLRLATVVAKLLTPFTMGIDLSSVLESISGSKEGLVDSDLYQVQCLR